MKNPNDMYADILFKNGLMITMDPLMPEATALAIKDRHIIWVGHEKDCDIWIGKNTHIIDLNGHYVYPGFVDTHMHVLYTGITSNHLQLNESTNKALILKNVKDQVKKSKPGDWIIGVGWDDLHWDEKENFHISELDIVSPDNPVVLVRQDTHLIWVNTFVLKLVGINADTPSPSGGQIGKDPSGNLNGILIDRAMGLAKSKIPNADMDTNKQIIQNVLQACLKKGITSIHNAATDETDFKAFQQLAIENLLNARIYLFAAIRDTQENDFIKQGPQTYGDFLQIRCLKLWMDGAMGSRGAALLEPYSDDTKNEGLLLWEKEDLLAILKDAKSKSFQVAIHAIGDKANRNVLDAYEEIGVNGLRWRIEHAQQLSTLDVQRFAQLGVIAAMQPLHLVADMPWIERRLGKERLETGAFLWKSLLDGGTIIAGGSDAPVVDFNPLLGIYAAITRQDFNQFPLDGWYPDQKVTRYQALKMYTIDAAYASFSENELGSLTKGKLADLVVLPENVLTCHPKALLNMKVRYTFVNGKMQYCA